MLHQDIPQYEGTQSFIYVCYCAEDEALAFPIIARMYNEGFRMWSHRAGSSAPGFRAMQRLDSAASVILFYSRNMYERLRSGDAIVAAVMKSAMLRTVITLDDLDPASNLFALSSPDKVDYKTGNDAGFWLYMYSADPLEPCRGPWPEKKLSLRDATYDDVSEDALKDEYAHIADLMKGASKSKKEKRYKESAESKYHNNKGYIPPQQDDMVYVPLDKVEAVRTEQDKEFDTVMSMIDQFVDYAAEAVRPAKDKKAQPVQAAQEPEIRKAETAQSEPQQPVMQDTAYPEARAGSVAQDIYQAQETVAQELYRAQQKYHLVGQGYPEPNFNQIGARQDIEPKADVIFTPVAREYNIKDYFPEGRPEPINYIPYAPPIQAAPMQNPVPMQQPVMQAAPMQNPVPMQQPVTQAAPMQNPVPMQQAAHSMQQAVTQVAPMQQPVIIQQAAHPMPQPVMQDPAPVQSVEAAQEAPESISDPVDDRKSQVPVMVRRAVSRAKSVPVKAVRHLLSAAVERAVEVTTAHPVRVEHPLVPSFAEAVIEEPFPSARKYRGKAMPEPIDEIEAAESAVIDIPADDEKPSARKNKHPHNSEMLSELLAALRESRAAMAAEHDPVVIEATVAQDASAPAADEAQSDETSTADTAPEEQPKDEPKRAHLTAAVEKFIENNTPRPISVVARLIAADRVSE